MHPALVLKLLILLAVANGAPVLAKRLLGPILARPLDAGKSFLDGRPLFGSSKTIRGIVIALAAGALAAPLLGVTWTTGLVVALAAMTGDLLSSFLKRRLDRPPSSQALGLDQIPESLLPALACTSLMGLTLADVMLVVALFFVCELVLSRLLFKLHIRDRPY